MTKFKEFWILSPDSDELGIDKKCVAWHRPPSSVVRESYPVVHVVDFQALESLQELHTKRLGELGECFEKRKAEKLRSAKLLEALKTLKVAVNDKVNDPGATAFISKAIADYEGEK